MPVAAARRATARGHAGDMLVAPSGDIASPALIVGGGRDSKVAHWADTLSDPLTQALKAPQPIDITTSSGRDGVTAANLFDARVTPDGNTALIVPGSAILASLAGDARVHFDFSRWVPLIVGQADTIVIGRADFHRSLRNLLRDRPVRVGVSTPTGLELPTLVALSLLGVRPVPVAGLATPESALDALNTNAVDVIQVPRAAVPDDRLAQLAQAGYPALFTLERSGAAADNNAAASSLPSFPAFYGQFHSRPPQAPLANGLRAISIAASTSLAVVLPMLTTPSLVAEWRFATHAACATLEREAAREGMSLYTGQNGATAYADANPDLTAQLAIKRWIAAREPEWRMG
ncbi:hypothetical protein AA103196_0334 [Ameyamaea chiangmaiensis NBRC 103196]|nr:hypothetical protein AA103196_0334 [Ameyamaea chiangmaiensis NBRC 103196]